MHTTRELVFIVATLALSPAIFAQQVIRVPHDYSTVQGGIQAAQNGDTVLVDPGIYRENIDFLGKRITVTSGAHNVSEASATVLAAAAAGPIVRFQSGEDRNSVLNGFTIRGGFPDPTRHDLAGGVYISHSSPTLQNNDVVQNTGCGILVVNGAGPSIMGGLIHQTLYPANLVQESDDRACKDPISGGGGRSGKGVVVDGGGQVEIRDTTIYENATKDQGQNGTSADTGAGLTVLRTSDLRLERNIIRENLTDDCQGVAISFVPSVSQLHLINNLLFGNQNATGPTPQQIGAQVCITGTGGTANFRANVISNTVYGRTTELVLFFGPSIFRNNVFYSEGVGAQNAQAILSGLFCADYRNLPFFPLDIAYNDVFNSGVLADGQCPLGNSTLMTDPRFRSVQNADYRLQGPSSLIDAGDVLAPDISPTDLDGKNRTVCGKIDIGAYQHHPSPTIALTSSGNPVPGGGTITFSAALASNCNVPTGVLTFLDGGIPIGAATLDGAGVAAFSTSFLVVGQHKITATYPGDFNFEDSTSPVLVQVITGDPTQTTFAGSPNPANAFSPIVLSAAVSSQYGTPTGSVAFQAGGTTLGTAVLDANGKAATTVSTLGAGTYLITANYTADTRFQPSTSATVQEVVVGANSLTSLTATPNPAFATQPVSLEASVRPIQGSVVPTGTVAFLDGGTSIGSALLQSGTATLTTVALGVGTHQITARYAGATNFDQSVGNVTEIVNLIGTGIALTAAPNPANGGQSVTSTASVSATPAGTVPAGIVTFRDGTTVLATVPLDGSGTATFATSSLAIGTHPLQAAFGGNAYFGASTSGVVNEVVQPYDFVVTLSQNSLNIPSGDWTRITVTVAPVGGFQGNVTIGCEGAPEHTQCVFDGDGTVSLAKGPQQITMVVNTSDVYHYGSQITRNRRQQQGRVFGLTFAALLFPVSGVLFVASGHRRRKQLPRLVLLLSSITLLCSIQACSGKVPASTLPGTYSFSVIATANDSTALRHANALTLIVTIPK